MTSSPPTIDAKVRARLSDGSLAGTWHLDGTQSTVGFKSKTLWGLVSVKGTFAQVSGEGVISPEGAVSGWIRVASASVDTKKKKRDAHLRSADFFNSDVHQDVTFTVDHLDLTSDGATAVGTLEVAGHKASLDVPVSVRLIADNTLELDAEIEIDRSEFGLTWNQMGMVSTKNTISIHAVFTRN
jgi:polyisoprenoid-binding protein YceI